MDKRARFYFFFCCYEDLGLERSQCVSSTNFCCLCLFHFPHRLVLCCFMYVSLVVSSMWFLCLSASYLFVSSLALLLFSLPFSPSTSCYLSPPHSHPHSISFSLSSPPLPLALTLIPYLPPHTPPTPPPLPFLSIFLILAALPAADDWSRFSRFALSCYLVGNVYARSSVLQSQLACVHAVFVTLARTYTHARTSQMHFLFFYFLYLSHTHEHKHTHTHSHTLVY